jgi:endonuclease/exonuclease/phosphatase family metal-dependent hydrolase
MGDFNDWRVQAPAFAPLEAHFPHVAAPPSFHTRRPLLRYDRLYASPGLRVLDCHIVQNRLARRASDHMPVLGRLIEESAPAGLPDPDGAGG